MSCGVGQRRSSDPSLLWLWRRLEATAPIQPLAWEPPYAEAAAQEMAKKIFLIKNKYINNKDLLSSTGNSTQYSVVTCLGKESEKEWVQVYV